MLAYLGPDTMLPLTSVIAGAVGVVLMFGRQIVVRLKDLARWVQQRLRGKPGSVQSALRSPHVTVTSPPGGGQGGASRLRRTTRSSS